MIDIMLDLETQGRRPGCQVLSIGAVAFGQEGLGEEFYVVLNVAEQADYGLHVDPETMAWWARQSAAARRVFDEPREPLLEGLKMFTEFVKDHGGMKAARVWGNGADFDNPILSAVYHAVGQEAPWAFWNSRCYRTLKGLPHNCGPAERQGTYHNALDDAKTQAVHALRILSALRAPAPAAAPATPSGFGPL